MYEWAFDLIWKVVNGDWDKRISRWRFRISCWLGSQHSTVHQPWSNGERSLTAGQIGNITSGKNIKQVGDPWSIWTVGRETLSIQEI